MAAKMATKGMGIKSKKVSLKGDMHGSKDAIVKKIGGKTGGK